MHTHATLEPQLPEFKAVVESYEAARLEFKRQKKIAHFKSERNGEMLDHDMYFHREDLLNMFRDKFANDETELEKLGISSSNVLI